MQKSRQALLADLFDDFDAAYEQSHLVGVLRKHQPQVLIDSVNTATGLSYQNVFDAALRVRQALLQNNHNNCTEETERMLLSQSVPALVRHIQILSRVAQELGLESYVKIGTTGTGGLGLNIPFTHSENKPSNLILSKNEAAFGHSGLLYLWGQTPGAPTVHEIKPGAAIGYRNVGVHEVSDRYGNEYIRKPRLVALPLDINSSSVSLNVREDESDYLKLEKMTAVAVDMGENGMYAADEFRVLSAPGSMELISPEEIAEVCVQELLGIGTGHNVLAAIRGAVLNSGYRAGTVRSFADALLAKLEEGEEEETTKTTLPSIALGKLGPPLLSKILFEAHILKLVFGGVHGIEELASCNPAELSRELSNQVQNIVRQNPIFAGTPITLASLIRVAPTIGVPVLLHDNVMLRGPNITVPEPAGRDSTFVWTTQEAMDCHAQTGWVDLRTPNLQLWKDRANHILSEPPVSSRNTTVLTGLHYVGSGKHREMDPAALASWILVGEVHGQRDLSSVHCPLDEQDSK